MASANSPHLDNFISNLLDVTDAQALLLRLAGRSHNAVNSWVAKLVGDKPWDYFSYDELVLRFQNR